MRVRLDALGLLLRHGYWAEQPLVVHVVRMRGVWAAKLDVVTKAAGCVTAVGWPPLRSHARSVILCAGMKNLCVPHFYYVYKMGL